MQEKIKMLCKEKGMTITSLEEAAGLPQKSIYRWGTMLMPAADKLARVAKILGTTVEELLGEDLKGGK